MLADPVLADPVLADPVLADPVLADPVLADPAPAPAPDEVLSVGVAPAPAPPEAGELDADEAGVEGPALADVEVVAVTLGLAVLDGVAVPVGQGVPVAAAAFLLPVALLLAFAEAVVVALLVAVALSVAVAVLVAVAVPLPLGLAPLGLAPPLAGLSLGLLLVPLGELVAVLAGVTLGVAGLVGLAAADDEEGEWHAVAVPLLWAAEVRLWLAPPPDVAPRLPDPARLGAPPLVLEEEIPTAEPSWTKASRSGGTARATPMANTAQAAARAGRSSPSRQSRGCRRAPPPPAVLPLPAASWPPRMAFQRRTRSARKPLRAEAPACLLA